MTSEQRTLIELTDITGIEFECRKCGAKVLYPFQERYERMTEKCPNCYEPWFLQEPQAADAPTTADQVKRIFAQLHKIATSPMVRAQVRLSVSGLPKDSMAS